MKKQNMKSQVTVASPPSLVERAWSELLPILIVMILTMAARSSLADHYIIPSGSMEYTLIPGDHVFVDKLAYGVRLPFTHIELSNGVAPQRGEVVIFDSPESGTRLIKRIVAEGGDVVSLISGELTINGKSMRNRDARGAEAFGDHVALLNLNYGGGPDIPQRTIPHGQLLVVGDARGNSRDGRFFGLIPEELPYGKATGVIYRKGQGIIWNDL